MKVKRSGARPKLRVTTDGKGVTSRAGTRLVADLADELGLTGTLSDAVASLRQRRSGHDPGRVLVDLALTLVDGGSCLSDLRVLRDQRRLFGEVASTSTASRVVAALDGDRLAAVDRARAEARARAWEAGAAPERVTLDVDATLVTAHSEKEGAAPTYKRGFGFHPIVCFCDETNEALAGILREGNAGSGTASDHVAVLDQALAQLPVKTRGKDPEDGAEILVRADTAGASHDFVEAIVERGLEFSIGFPMTAEVATAAVSVPERAWVEAIGQDCEIREGAEVAEITDHLDLSSWPEGTRVIVRREDPHDGAQFTFTDLDGHRFQAFITNQTDTDLAYLEARHRGHARVEDRIRDAKDTGLSKFPFEAFAQNQVWLTLALIACDLIAWFQTRCLEGELAKAEPRRLRYTLLHTAGRLATRGRRLHLRLQHDWPWAQELAAAFTRLQRPPLPA